MAVSEAQKRAKKNYNKRNPEKVNRAKYLTTARTFVRRHATKKEMEELNHIFQEENLNAKEG